MQLTIHWGSGSSVSWRALLALAIKGLDYRSERLNLGEKQHRSEAYLSLNPRGTFPLLVAEELRVRGSMAILNTLERLAPDPPLFGSSVDETAAIWQLIDDHADHLEPSTQALARAFFRKQGDRSDAIIEPALEVVAKELTLLEERQGEGAWLAGTQVSAADVVHYPTVHRLLRAAKKSSDARLTGLLDPDLRRFPRLGSWLKRMATLPGVEGTYPPHWREE